MPYSLTPLVFNHYVRGRCGQALHKTSTLIKVIRIAIASAMIRRVTHTQHLINDEAAFGKGGKGFL